MFPISLFPSIASLFKNNKTAVISVLVALLFGVFSLKQCNQAQAYKKKLAVAEHNIKAAEDTIRMVKDASGKVEYDKLAFLTDKLSNLEKMNASLASEVKTIKGKVATIVSGSVKIVEKPVPFIVKGELVDSVVRADFKYDSVYSPGNFRKLSGYTKYDLRNGSTSGEKTVDEVGVKFKTGIKNLDKGKPEIFLSSDYPGFSVTELTGAVLDPTLFSTKPKTKLITTGLNIGWTPVTYDLQTRKMDFRPQRFGATVGININVVKLLTKKP